VQFLRTAFDRYTKMPGQGIQIAPAAAGTRIRSAPNVSVRRC
jgi:hypothetical protein